MTTHMSGSNRGEAALRTDDCAYQRLVVGGGAQAPARLRASGAPVAAAWTSPPRTPLTLLVAPVGAGKTLGVSGWLRRTGRSMERTTWIHADRSWTPARLEALLESARTGPGHDCGPAARRHRRCPRATPRRAPDDRPPPQRGTARHAVAAALPLGPAAQQTGAGASRALHDPARRAPAHGPGRVRPTGHRARAHRGPCGAQGGVREGQGLVRPRGPDRARDRHRPGPARGRRPVRRRGRVGGRPGRHRGLRSAPATRAPPAAVPGRRGDRQHGHRAAPVPRLQGRGGPLRAGDHGTAGEPAAASPRVHAGCARKAPRSRCGTGSIP